MFIVLNEQSKNNLKQQTKRIIIRFFEYLINYYGKKEVREKFYIKLYSRWNQDCMDSTI